MKTIRNILKTLTTASLLTGLAMNFTACSEQSPVASNGQNLSSKETLNILKLSSGSGSLNKTVVVSQTITPEGGAKLFLQAGPDAELIALIKQTPPLRSPVLARKLYRASPLSSAVLHAAIFRDPPMVSAHLTKVLVKNSPLSESVLQSAIDSHVLNKRNLAAVLIKSSPLPTGILTQVEHLGFTKRQLRKILKAQNKRGYEKDDDYGEGSVFVEMIVEPGAVNETIEISVSVDDEEISGDVFLIFGPHGTVFNEPIKMNIELHGLDLDDVEEDDLNIYYTNGETGQWELMESTNIIVKKNKGIIKIVGAKLPHFSRYAIGSE